MPHLTKTEMDKYKETFETWNKVATLYQDNFMELDLYNDTYDMFCENIVKEKPTLLEIGCGPGNITKYLLTKRPDFNVEAIDISPNMVELAKRNNPTANFKVMDSREIDKLKTKYDAIVCGFCLPYLSESDNSKLIKDCYNILTDNGIIYFSFVEGDYEKSGYQSGSSGDRTYFYYHSLASVKNKLEENNFKTINLLYKQYNRKDGTAETHTVLMAKKQTNAPSVSGLQQV